MNEHTTAKERALAALDVIDRFDPFHPRVTAAYASLAQAMDEIYGPLSPPGEFPRDMR